MIPVIIYVLQDIEICIPCNGTFLGSNFARFRPGTLGGTGAAGLGNWVCDPLATFPLTGLGPFGGVGYPGNGDGGGWGLINVEYFAQLQQ